MRSLEDIIKDVIKGKDYCEISMNQYYQEKEGYGPQVTGYNGYEASRESNIEETDLGKELQAKLLELHKEIRGTDEKK